MSKRVSSPSLIIGYMCMYTYIWCVSRWLALGVPCCSLPVSFWLLGCSTCQISPLKPQQKVTQKADRQLTLLAYRQTKLKPVHGQCYGVLPVYPWRESVNIHFAVHRASMAEANSL